MDQIKELFESLENPPMRHAIMVHFPIVLANLVIPIAILTAMMKDPKRGWRIVTSLVLLAFTVSAYVAVEAGENAESHLGEVMAKISEAVHEHEEAAEYLAYFGLGAFLISLIAFVPKKQIQIAGRWLTVIAALVVLWRITTAAHLGGELVFEYGAGTPNPMTQQQYDVEHASETGIDASAVVDDPRLVYFRRKIKPILNENCFGCHHPQAKKTQLDLTSFRGMQTTGKHSPIIVPGDPDASFIMQVLEWTGELKMPKGDDQLPAEVIADIRQWIKDGAVWE